MTQNQQAILKEDPFIIGILTIFDSDEAKGMNRGESKLSNFVDENMPSVEGIYEENTYRESDDDPHTFTIEGAVPAEEYIALANYIREQQPNVIFIAVNENGVCISNDAEQRIYKNAVAFYVAGYFGFNGTADTISELEDALREGNESEEVDEDDELDDYQFYNVTII